MTSVEEGSIASAALMPGDEILQVCMYVCSDVCVYVVFNIAPCEGVVDLGESHQINSNTSLITTGAMSI